MPERLSTAAVAASFLILMGTPSIAADADAGRKLAETHCARCHVVGGFNPGGGISSTPSFQWLVKRRKDFRIRFESFYVRPPHPAVVVIEGVPRKTRLPFTAFPIFLRPGDVENIAAFAETLKPSP